MIFTQFSFHFTKQYGIFIVDTREADVSQSNGFVLLNFMKCILC